MKYTKCQKCGKYAVGLAMANSITVTLTGDDDGEDQGKYDGQDVQTDTCVGTHVCFECGELEDVFIEYPEQVVALDNGAAKPITQFETFREFRESTQQNLTQDYPSCFNRIVRIKKYRITIEEVEETDEVIRDRIRKLWNSPEVQGNHYYRSTLLAAAREYGIADEFTGKR